MVHLPVQVALALLRQRPQIQVRRHLPVTLLVGADAKRMQAHPKASVVHPPVQFPLALLRHRLFMPDRRRLPVTLLVGAAAQRMQVVAQGQVVDLLCLADQGRSRRKPVARLHKLPQHVKRFSQVVAAFRTGTLGVLPPEVPAQLVALQSRERLPIGGCLLQAFGRLSQGRRHRWRQMLRADSRQPLRRLGFHKLHQQLVHRQPPFPLQQV